MTMKKKLTVADLLKIKGSGRKLVLTTAFDEWTARAAEEAGVDMIVAWGSCLEHTKFVVQAVRRGAPNTLIGSGINPGAYESAEKALNIANQVRAAGVDMYVSFHPYFHPYLHPNPSFWLTFILETLLIRGKGTLLPSICG